MIKRYSHVILKEILKNIKLIHNKRSKALDTSLNAECGTSRYWKALGDIEHYTREIEGFKADLKQLDDVVSMVNAYVIAAKAYSGESAYNLLENELDRIMEDE
ncbi:DUF1140 family protein [Staphylococcus pseudintermedius]|nr:DUF1140 family protein [Staphylococcus pseudintermedius]